LAAQRPAADGTIMPSPYQVVLDTSGNPVSGACVWTYVAGTTTPAATYTNVGLTVANSNPIIASSAGRFTAFLALGASYKFTYEGACTPPSHGTSILTVDNVASVPGSAANLDLVGTAGEALTAGLAVYLSDGSGGKTAGLWYIASSANTYSSTTPQVGFAVAAVSSLASGTIRLGGSMTGLSSLSVGSIYYLSTAGAITSTAPTNRRFVGQADTTTSLVASPDPPIPAVPSITVTATKTANYTAVVGDYVVCNGTFTVALPTAASISGQLIDVKNIGTGIITVDPAGSETVDAAATITIPQQYQEVTLISDGTNWYIR
jgi:hypothetical protein